MWTPNAEGVFESDLLKQFRWLWHGFGSRLSGSWPGDYASVKQIHSALVQVAKAPLTSLGEGDAILSATSGVRVGIRTADCVPLLLADPEHRAVGAVHAGWRGTAAEIARLSVERLQHEFGSNPGQIRVAIGPCIGGCCFEVGPEVAQHFNEFLQPGKGDRPHIDLSAANVKQLLEAGVLREHIDVSNLCTVCDPARLHSFRRDKEASGRMVAAIGVVDSPTQSPS